MIGGPATVILRQTLGDRRHVEIHEPGRRERRVQMRRPTARRRRGARMRRPGAFIDSAAIDSTLGRRAGEARRGARETRYCTPSNKSRGPIDSACIPRDGERGRRGESSWLDHQLMYPSAERASAPRTSGESAVQREPHGVQLAFLLIGPARVWVLYTYCALCSGGEPLPS